MTPKWPRSDAETLSEYDLHRGSTRDCIVSLFCEAAALQTRTCQAPVNNAFISGIKTGLSVNQERTGMRCHVRCCGCCIHSRDATVEQKCASGSWTRPRRAVYACVLHAFRHEHMTASIVTATDAAADGGIHIRKCRNASDRCGAVPDGQRRSE